MEDRSNIIKEAIEYRDKLEAKVKLQDEYIASLLLSLFLMQGEIDRLNETLDLARKGELVYIKNPQIEKLKAENARLKEKIIKLSEEKGHLIVENNTLKEELATYGATGICEVCSDKANKLADKYLGCLQEIKEIAEMDICSNCITQKREDNCQCLADTILQIITKAESEG